MQALGEAYEGELRGDIRQHVRHGELAADAGDVDDGTGATRKHVRHGGVGGVERGVEVGGHGPVVGFKRLVLDGADFDDAGVVDEDVDTPERGDGVIDEASGLVLVGEVGGDEEDVVLMLDGAAVEQALAGAAEFVVVAGGEHELGSRLAETLREREAEAPRAAGDDDDLAGADVPGQEGVGSGGGKGASGYL